MLDYLKFFMPAKNKPTKHLVVETVYGSPLHKQRSIIQAAPQFKDAFISIQFLNPNDRLIGLKVQQPVLGDQLDDKLFIMYPAASIDQAANMVMCAPKKMLSCLKISPPQGKHFYLIRVEDIKTIPMENTPQTDTVSTRLAR